MIKRIGILMLSGAALFSVVSSSAQNYQGLLLDHDIVTPADIYELSQTDFSFGTARSMSMAGAFTSLGGDLTSMAINPAGLGMYRRGEISITPAMVFQRSTTDASPYERNGKNRFILGNFGFTANVYQGSGTVASINLGFGYNRIQDLNYQYSFQTHGNQSSLADVFSMMLQYGGISKDQLGGDAAWSNVNTQFWGAVLGYKTGLTDYVDGTGWYPSWIGNDVAISNYTTVVSTGSVGEYDLSLGMNLSNKFYIGATLGIQSLHQRKTYYYGEDYYYPGDGIDPNLDYQLLYSNFNQEVVVDGAGVNFKFGMIYRPFQNLRIGVAFHTPTYFWVDRTYQGYADSKMRLVNLDNPDNIEVGPQGVATAWLYTPVLEDRDNFNWQFSTPTRLMFGISYAFGNRGLISIDYERDWYNGMRMQSNPASISNESYNNTFRDWYKGANLLRVGAEFKPLPMLALRAGFGYMGSMLKDEKAITAVPMTRQMLYGAAGIGILLTPGIGLDFAYSYSTTNYTEYQLYSFEAPEGLNASRSFKTKMNRHTAALTMSFRF